MKLLRIGWLEYKPSRSRQSLPKYYHGASEPIGSSIDRGGQGGLRETLSADHHRLHERGFTLQCYQKLVSKQFDRDSPEQIYRNLTSYLVTEDCKKLSGSTVAGTTVESIWKLLLLQGRPGNGETILKMRKCFCLFKSKAGNEMLTSKYTMNYIITDMDLLNALNHAVDLNGNKLTNKDLQVAAQLAFTYCSGCWCFELNSIAVASLSLKITGRDDSVVNAIPVGDENGDYIRTLSFTFVWSKSEGIVECKHTIVASEHFHENAVLLLLRSPGYHPVGMGDL